MGIPLQLPADHLAGLAILQPDARASARLTAALGDVHRVVESASWEALETTVSTRAVQGCLVDADHPNRDEAEQRIGRLRRKYPALTIVGYVESSHRDGYFDLGGLGFDGLITSGLAKHALRTTVDQAFSNARGAQVERSLRGRVAEPGPEMVAWAVVNAARETSVERMASALGQTPRGLRDALAEIGLPTPKVVLLWGRLLLAGARLEQDERSLEEVAFSLGYATASSLARAMKRKTGYTPKQVTDNGGMRLVKDALIPHGDSPRPSRFAKLASVAFLAALAGCASVGLGGGGVDRNAIGEILESPGIGQMHVGVLAVDARSGETLYSHNGARKFIPASNQKVLVAAAAMSMLGPAYRFRTDVWATGSASGAFLDGDLVLVGSGDPTLSDRYWDSGTAALTAIADSLRATGLQYVAGSLFVDVSAWDSTTVAPTREVEDLRFSYGATGGAFGIDEGELELVVQAGPAVGSPATVEWSPIGTHDYVRSRLRTAPPDSSVRVTPHYLPETRQLVLEGGIEFGTVDTVSIASRDPVRQASAALARAIQESGIELEAGWEMKWTEGERVGRGCLSGMLEECASAARLVTLESPPLADISAGILQPSQNWMTEQLIRAMSAIYGEEGSWSEGTDLVEAFLFEHVGVDTLDVSARDGSGLSAYNLVTPRALIRVLRHMADGPYGAEFREALAKPGEDGSLENRLLELEGRVFAKTGTISNVNSLTGYLVGRDGREIVFSILSNGSGLPASYVRAAIDDIVRALAR